MTFSQCVERGLEMIQRQVSATRTDGFASTALFRRVARAVLRADGERNPGSSLVDPLVEALRRGWNDARRIY